MEFLPTWPLHVSPLIAFGAILIVGALGGFLAHRLPWLPSISGFLLVGFICGPSGLGLFDAKTIAESQILLDIALALILYRLGLSLDIKTLLRSRSLILVSLIESAITFVAVFFLLRLFSIAAPLAALVAAIAISSSPAVLLHVTNEVNAEGPVTDSTKTLVALNNLISFIAFSATLPTLLYSNGSEWKTVVLQPLYGFVGSLLIGVIFAYALHFLVVKTKHAAQYKLALVIGTLMTVIGLAAQLKLSMLFAPLVIGVAVKSVERRSLTSNLEFGAPFELFFIVLFVLAGASLHLRELIEFAPLVLLLVAARSAAKLIGTTATLSLFKQPLRGNVARGLLLMPMAGLAIGLSQTAGELFPAHAASVHAIVLGAVAVFETIGPPIAAFALRFAGEAHADGISGEPLAMMALEDSDNDAPHP